mmetsp:Transcript_16816/g.55825  ORF Transcript_16816/g.55825 Transcript_16816/m.55825 type:complete len:1970 (-) Transcript_16816:70-5979(-)
MFATSVQQPPQPFVSADEVHRAFEQGSYFDDEVDSQVESITNLENTEGDFRREAALVTDYRTELPEEESEGYDYHMEKRYIRENIELQGSHVFMWGDGENGKLGNQSEEIQHVPYIVPAFRNVLVKVCALGKQHTLFLSADGVVLSCGSNVYGQLGMGDHMLSRSTPAIIQSLNNIVGIAAGYYHSLALNDTGKIFSWGSGSWGKLGIGSDANAESPRFVASLQNSKVVHIACGAHHTAAITTVGDVWTWGKGLRGQLGHKSVKEEFSPRLNASLRKCGAQKIRCGDDHTLVILRSGQLYSMGANTHGQLGLGDATDRIIPTLVTGFANEKVIDIDAKGCRSIALTNTGKVFAFGNETEPHLNRIPRFVAGLPKSDLIIAVARTAHFDFAISDTGQLFRWRPFSSEEESSRMLESFHAIKGVVRMFCGHNHMAVICSPEMGCTQAMISRNKSTSFSSDISRASLEKFPSEKILPALGTNTEYLDEFATVQVRDSPSREGDGYIYTYGKGVFGRLGHGVEYTRSEESVKHPKRIETLAKMSVVFIACGKDSTAALTDTGKVYTWGKSAQGKLGLGSGKPLAIVVPQLVQDLSSHVVCQISLGRNHAACSTDMHKFFVWGSNTFGQLGIPHISSYMPDPYEITSLREANIRSIACGGWHTLISTNTGSVMSCGKGWHGQLGHGDYESLTALSKTLPYFKKIVEGFGDSFIVKVSAGKESSAAITNKGRLFTWGKGDEYQLGHESSKNEAYPREVEFFAKIRVVDVSIGDSHMLALDYSGLPYSWGNGSAGQLGHGEMCERETLPRPIMLCRRGLRDGIEERFFDIQWGSFYMQKETLPGEDEEVEVMREERGKVCMIEAYGNYSLFVLERLANKQEILLYEDAVKKQDHSLKKMTKMTRIRELFGCGSGRHGILQNVGKEKECLPKHLPFTDDGDELQDIFAISGGKAHVGMIVRQDPLRNVEWRNITDMQTQNIKAQMQQRKNQASSQLLDLSQLDIEDNIEDLHVQDFFENEVEYKLTEALKSLPSFEYGKWLSALLENDVDLETLSTLQTDENLRLIGITAIGARRRLLKEIMKMPKQFPPMFYSYKDDQRFYFSWPPSITGEIAKAKNDEKKARAGGPFKEYFNRLNIGRILQCLVRYSEKKHFEQIRDRANKRYEVDLEGEYHIYTWGCGVNGRLGHGFHTGYSTPQEITSFPSNTKIVEVACGCEHSLARSFDGGVYAWGAGDRGQLGSLENFDCVKINYAFNPQPVLNLKRYFILSIACGRWHNMTLTSERQVLSWGAGEFGQLGLDHNLSKGTPQMVKALDGRAPCKILCGGWHSAAILESGKILLWGKNVYGQLGHGDTKSCSAPRVNQYLRLEGKVRTAGLGANHTLVVMVANKVFAMGSNIDGQLGLDDPSRTGKNVPVSIEELNGKNICQVAAGDQHSLALSVFGEVWSWGGSPFGQLGHETITDKLAPTPLLERHKIPPDVKSIACGYTFSAAMSAKGEVFTWGNGESGELGHAPKVLTYAPSLIKDFSEVVQIACGFKHMAGIVFKPRMKTIELTGSSNIGDNSTTFSGSIAAGSVSGSTRSHTTGHHTTRTSAFSASNQKRHGCVFVWGEDTCGQLGIRGLQAARSPSLMQSLLATSIVHISANSDMSAFVTDSGSLYVSGGSEHGRLGLGHMAPAPTPVEIRSLNTVKIMKVACGTYHCLALTEEKRVYAWGDGKWGNAGVSNTNDVLEPQELSSLAACSIIGVHAGGFHSAALSQYGDLFMWGKNSNGQLGLGTTSAAEDSPTKISNLDGVVMDVSLGANHSAVLMQVTSPNLFTCGLNANGQLGLGDFVDRSTLTAVDALDDRQIVSASCGAAHTAAVSQYGDLITWGNGRNGQLGLKAGLSKDIENPVQLPAICNDPMVKVVCGQEVTIVVSEKGELYMAGYESTIGLGGNSSRRREFDVSFREVEGLIQPTQIAVGSVHVLALVGISMEAA